jgi:hypothetical protein
VTVHIEAQNSLVHCKPSELIMDFVKGGALSKVGGSICDDCSSDWCSCCLTAADALFQP